MQRRKKGAMWSIAMWRKKGTVREHLQRDVLPAGRTLLHTGSWVLGLQSPELWSRTRRLHFEISSQDRSLGQPWGPPEKETPL